MEKHRTTTNHQLYELDKGYKNDTNLINYIDEAQNFYNGNQYPNANYKNMLRVTLNICSFAANIKASKICGTPIYLTYTADDNKTDCTALQRFDEYNCNKMHLKTNNFQAALNGFVNGTEITYIRWDGDDTTYKGIYKGGLAEEHIDIRNFAVANPYIQEIQNQQWVMFWEDFSVGAIKEMVEGRTEEEKREKIEMIEREGANEDEYKNKDAINHALCRVYTRFFRVDGEVYFMCSTEKVDIFTYPHPLSRSVNKAKVKKIVDDYYKQLDDKIELDENGDVIPDYKIDYEDVMMNITSSDTFSDKEYKEIKEKFSLYPFAVFRPFAMNRSFYGRSDIKSIIPIQKGLNFAISMNLKCVENNAYNKIFVKPEALGGQIITNEPGQVIVDHSGFTNGWGIKFAESQPMPNGLSDFASSLFGMTRTIYGFSDVMDGSLTNQDMSGYMLQQMIKQSNTSIEQQQQLFWRYNEDKAAIRLMYYKHYVDRAKYTFELSDSEYEAEEQARKMLYQGALKGALTSMPNAKPEDFATPTHKTQIREITNEDMYGVNFDISIESMQGLQDSKLVEQQMWDNLVWQGGLQNIEPEMLELYFQYSPSVSPRTKTSIKGAIENLKQSKIARLEGQLTQLAQQTEQIMAYAKQLEAANGYQSEYLKNLQGEFTSKINMQNQIIGGLSKDLEKYREVKPTSSTASEGEVKSNNSRGIEGTTTQK
jgi:hypothetical protein